MASYARNVIKRETTVEKGNGNSFSPVFLPPFRSCFVLRMSSLVVFHEKFFVSTRTLSVESLQRVEKGLRIFSRSLIFCHFTRIFCFSFTLLLLFLKWYLVGLECRFFETREREREKCSMTLRRQKLGLQRS